MWLRTGEVLTRRWKSNPSVTGSDPGRKLQNSPVSALTVKKSGGAVDNSAMLSQEASADKAKRSSAIVLLAEQVSIT